MPLVAGIQDAYGENQPVVSLSAKNPLTRIDVKWNMYEHICCRPQSDTTERIHHENGPQVSDSSDDCRDDDRMPLVSATATPNAAGFAATATAAADSDTWMITASGNRPEHREGTTPVDFPRKAV